MKQVHVHETQFNWLMDMLKWFDNVPSVPLPDYFWERNNETMLDLLGEGIVDKNVDIEDFYVVELIEDNGVLSMIARDVEDEPWAIVI